jgi:dCMP deaminase
MNRFDLKLATFMSMAFQLATLSTCPRRQVGCILLDADLRIIGSGYNGVAKGQYHCCNLSDSPCNCIHAEVNALKSCKTPTAIKYAICTTAPCRACFDALTNAAEALQGGIEAIYVAQAASSSVDHPLILPLSPVPIPYAPWVANKVGGTYRASGTIRNEFQTSTGSTLLAFEFSDFPGMCHLFSPKQLIGSNTKRLVPCYGTYKDLTNAEVNRNRCEACQLMETCRRESYNAHR